MNQNQTIALENATAFKGDDEMSDLKVNPYTPFSIANTEGYSQQQLDAMNAEIANRLRVLKRTLSKSEYDRLCENVQRDYDSGNL